MVRFAAQPIDHEDSAGSASTRVNGLTAHSARIYANLDYSNLAFTVVRMMRKSIHTKEYAVFLGLLIEKRRQAGLTQAQIGDKLPIDQPGISKIERGERRVDVIELRMICDGLGIKLGDFITELEKRLAKKHG